jgi:hypothetical protein
LKKGREVSTSFCEQKEPKKLFYTGVWVFATASSNGTVQSSKSFLVLFFKKELLAFALNLRIKK